MSKTVCVGRVEPFVSIVQAAEALGVHKWALRRAVKTGLIPSYQPFNSRKLVKLSEVVAFIEATVATVSTPSLEIKGGR